MKFKAPSIICVLVLFLMEPAFAQSKLNQIRTSFAAKMSLHNSNSKVHGDLRGYTVSITTPEDIRSNFFGEKFYKHTTLLPINDIFTATTMKNILRKMVYDLTGFGADTVATNTGHHLTIRPSVEVFRSGMNGIFWYKVFAKVRLNLVAIMNDSIIINKKYESLYSSSGFDLEFEGPKIVGWPSEDMNIALGMTLRKCLDQFYTDLFKVSGTKEFPLHLSSVLFRVGTADLFEESYHDLDTVSSFLKNNPRAQIELDGYTDVAGDIREDKKLAKTRVNKIKSDLVKRGIRPRRIKCRAFGATNPISTTQDEDTRKLNRRVEFIILKI